MARQLVPTRGDLAHEVGPVFGYPAQHEKRCVDATFVEQVQQAAGVVFDAQLIARPALARHDVGERFDLEVVLDVDAEHVFHGKSGLGGRRARRSVQT